MVLFLFCFFEFLCFLKALLEAVNTPGGVDKNLFASEEWMGFGVNLQYHTVILEARAGLECRTVGHDNVNDAIIRVDTFFHGRIVGLKLLGNINFIYLTNVRNFHKARNVLGCSFFGAVAFHNFYMNRCVFLFFGLIAKGLCFSHDGFSTS